MIQNQNQYFSIPGTKELKNIGIPSYLGSKYCFGIWILLPTPDSINVLAPLWGISFFILANGTRIAITLLVTVH